MESIIYIAGIYNVGFAVFHAFFSRLFHWKKELNKLRFENRGIMQILNIQLIIFFLFVAAVCFFYTTDVLNTELGRFFLIGNAIFWVVRTIQQFVFLRANHIAIHSLTVIFLAGSILFALPLILNT